MSEFVEKVRSALRGFSAMKTAKTVVCGLSGGADSVSLLLALKELSGELGFTAAACHLNHGLRGDESDNDERFCAELCGKLGIPLCKKRESVRDYAEKHESLEETARKVRYDFFEEALAVFGENSVLATAHNANDNAETVLLNLIRGTGLRGLCGIPPERGRIIRPLLDIPRVEIELFLGENAQDYVTDKTNFSVLYTRNKVRAKILPEILEINPSFLSAIARMSKNLRADEDFFDEAAEKILEESKSGRGYSAEKIDACSEPIKTRAVKKILSGGGVEPSALRIKTAVSLLKKRSARYNTSKNRFFTIRKGVCFMEEIEQRFGGFNEKKD